MTSTCGRNVTKTHMVSAISVLTNCDYGRNERGWNKRDWARSDDAAARALFSAVMKSGRKENDFFGVGVDSGVSNSDAESIAIGEILELVFPPVVPGIATADTAGTGPIAEFRLDVRAIDGQQSHVAPPPVAPWHVFADSNWHAFPAPRFPPVPVANTANAGQRMNETDMHMEHDRLVQLGQRLENATGPPVESTRRRSPNWTAEETDALEKGVRFLIEAGEFKKSGNAAMIDSRTGTETDKWRKIYELHKHVFDVNGRTTLELKAKWGNILRARGAAAGDGAGAQQLRVADACEAGDAYEHDGSSSVPQPPSVHGVRPVAPVAPAQTPFGAFASAPITRGPITAYLPRPIAPQPPVPNTFECAPRMAVPIVPFPSGAYVGEDVGGASASVVDDANRSEPFPSQHQTQTNAMSFAPIAPALAHPPSPWVPVKTDPWGAEVPHTQAAMSFAPIAPASVYSGPRVSVPTDPWSAPANNRQSGYCQTHAGNANPEKPQLVNPQAAPLDQRPVFSNMPVPGTDPSADAGPPNSKRNYAQVPFHADSRGDDSLFTREDANAKAAPWRELIDAYILPQNPTLTAARAHCEQIARDLLAAARHNLDLAARAQNALRGGDVWASLSKFLESDSSSCESKHPPSQLDVVGELHKACMVLAQVVLGVVRPAHDNRRSDCEQMARLYNKHEITRYVFPTHHVPPLRFPIRD